MSITIMVVLALVAMAAGFTGHKKFKTAVLVVAIAVAVIIAFYGSVLAWGQSVPDHYSFVSINGEVCRQTFNHAECFAVLGGKYFSTETQEIGWIFAREQNYKIFLVMTLNGLLPLAAFGAAVGLRRIAVSPGLRASPPPKFGS